MKRRDLLKAGAAAAAFAGTVPVRVAAGTTATDSPGAAPAVPPPPVSQVSARPLPAGLERELLPKAPLPLRGKSSGPTIRQMSVQERERRRIVPRRGVCSIAPGKPFRDTLLSGNGGGYLELSGAPYAEQVLFHHERLMLPWRRPFEAPKVAGKLPAI